MCCLLFAAFASCFLIIPQNIIEKKFYASDLYTNFFLLMKGLKNDFVRNILWTFEDIHMLVGSNMPIFGGGRYPAVSLRLR